MTYVTTITELCDAIQIHFNNATKCIGDGSVLHFEAYIEFTLQINNYKTGCNNNKEIQDWL